MSEKVLVRQNRSFETEFQSIDPHEPESDELMPVHALHELTPYGMFLAGLASCTSIVLHTYAQNHGFDLQEVQLTVSYERVFDEDCENCEGVERYTELINEDIVLKGDLSDADRSKLHRIASYCPIHKMLENGVPIRSELRDA
jgi:uncharacterized OsmC-like protein